MVVELENLLMANHIVKFRDDVFFSLLKGL